MTDESVESPLDEAQQQGYQGVVPDNLPNEAYQVDADHADTAAQQREQRQALRSDAIAASRDPDTSSSSSKSSSKSSPKRSSERSSSSSTSSGSSSS